MPESGSFVADYGVTTVKLERWNSFYELIEQRLANASDYIWRGHRRGNWKLEPSLDRVLREIVPGAPPDAQEKRDRLRREHLNAFKYAVRGRRGVNPKELTDDNDWWALGQHYGLRTPLLDWTKSPFAAAYFAFMEGFDATPERVVFGLHRKRVEAYSNALYQDARVETGRPDYVEFISPLSDENPRLVGQGGLFTRAPNDTSVDDWVRLQYILGDEWSKWAFDDVANPVLIRVEIPDSERVKCLRALNRMNINHLSLFPDIAGASEFANLSLQIENY